MISRFVLLLSLAWMRRLTSPLFTLLEYDISGRDLILMAGGIVPAMEELTGDMGEPGGCG